VRQDSKIICVHGKDTTIAWVASETSMKINCFTMGAFESIGRASEKSSQTLKSFLFKLTSDEIRP
jgi:hypothetical protein